MTGVSGRDDAELPVFDAVEPAVAALGATGNRTPPPGLGPARGAGAAAAIVALLVVGIAVGSLSLAADPAPSPDVSINASPSARPSGSADGACRPPRQGQLPAVTLGVQGTRREVSGLFGFGSGLGHQSREPGWQVPPPARGLAVAAGADLVLAVGLGACFRHVIADYAPTRSMPVPDPITVFNDDLVPPARTVVLDGLPDGDWIVRVTAHFETFETVSDDIMTVTYFRILSGKGPFITAPPTVAPAPTPRIAPAVSCGPLPPVADMRVSLMIGTAAPVAGASMPGTDPPEVHVPLGDPVRMVIDGEVCATSWTLDMISLETGESTTVDMVSNPADDPGYAAQNQWDIPANGQSGQMVLTADLHFPGGLHIVRSWRLIVEPFQLPGLFLVGPDGKRFEASPGCGLSMHLSNGYEASDSCGSIGYAPGPEALRVRAYRAIHVELPGWQIVGWSAMCGRVTTVDTEQFDSRDGCSLGSSWSEDGGPLPDRPAFVLPPGDTVVQIGIAAIDGSGNRFDVTYYAHVIAR